MSVHTGRPLASWAFETDAAGRTVATPSKLEEPAMSRWAFETDANGRTVAREIEAEVAA